MNYYQLQDYEADIAEREALYHRIEQLEEALRNCMSLAREAMSYVDQYFRSKWNMDDELGEIKKVLKEGVVHGHDSCLE